jgi:sortase (surface protein transpeptidase)
MDRLVMPIAGIAVGLALVVGGIALGRPPSAPVRADEIAPLTTPAPDPTARPPSASATPSASPVPIETLGYGWRIRIARVGIDLPLRDGDATRDVALQRTPDGAAYRLAGSALPGTAGNTYVYGHARWAQFIGLWYAHLDDLVVVTGPGRTLYFRVTQIHPRVATDDLTYLLPENDGRLTLQTSTGPGPNDPRFIVVAMPASK